MKNKKELVKEAEEMLEVIEGEKKEYRAEFKKTVWGFATFSAKSLKDAKKKIETGEADWEDDYSEHDNESDTEWGDIYEN